MSRPHATGLDPGGVRRRRLLAAFAASAVAPLGLAAASALAQEGGAPPGALARIRARGTLKVALYEEMPPFHDHGAGIDVDLARLLAAALGVTMTPLPFAGDDKMEDDLRNMVWKGHYLGYGPADVLIHVPVDRPLMEANPQVHIFGPYFHERVMIARDLKRAPKLDSFADLGAAPIAVSSDSLAGVLLLGADGGKYAPQLVTHWKDGTEAAESLQRGEAIAAAGMASELETVLAGDERFAIGPLPLPRGPLDGWNVGLAVKADAMDLAEALQATIDAAAGDGGLDTIFAKAHVKRFGF